MKLSELIALLRGSNLYSTLDDFSVAGLTCNSAEVSPNFIFVAIKGTQQDGHRFIPEAIAKGARAIIVQSPPGARSLKSQVNLIQVKDTRQALAKLASSYYGRPSTKIKVVGITGTNGKTTVSYLVEAIIRASGLLPAVIGTVNYRFGDRIIPSKNTTPGPVELQAMLSEMVKAKVKYCLIEVSSHALDQNRTEEIDFSSAIFTNLTQDHLDYHLNLEDYFQAKAKLFRGLSRDTFAVINQDDRYGQRLKNLTKAKIITYGIEKTSNFMAKEIKVDARGITFLSLSPDNKKTFMESKLIGRHNVYNILAAFAWATQEGLDLKVIKSSLEGFSLVPGRMERIDAGQDFSVFVDYAHTEDALKNVIQALRQISKNRILVVFGCGGDRDKDKRPKMGYVVTELADYAIITSDNPRSEEPEKIIAQIRKGIKKDNYNVIADRYLAIKQALSLARSGDIVLIAGKGHENYQILKDKIMPFDDREVVRECLRSMKY